MKENVVKIEEVYSEAEKREHEEWFAQYREIGSLMPESAIISLENRRKERIIKPLEDLKKSLKRTKHSFTLDTEIEKLLLKHYERTGAWSLNKLNEFVLRVFYKGLYEIAIKEGTASYRESYIHINIGTLTEHYIKEQGEPEIKNIETIKTGNKSNIIQFRRMP